MRKLVRCHWSLLVALLVLWLTLGAVVLAWLQRADGALFTYALDDAYIHLALAKNLATHGIFGVTRYDFSPSSSSLLWTLLLSAIYWAYGPSTFAPLLLNLWLASGIIVLAYVFLSAHVDQKLLFVALLALIFLPPLVPMVFTGMEHELQIGLDLAFVYLAARSLARERDDWPWLLWALAPALTATRYEGLFLLGVVALLLILRRRLWPAFALMALGILPLVAFSIVSVANGGLVLPNSIALKGTVPAGNALSVSSVLQVFKTAALRLAVSPHLLAGILIAVSLCIMSWRRMQPWDIRRTPAVIFVLTTVLHVSFAQVGWFYRYEAYLVSLGIVAVTLMLAEKLPDASLPRPRQIMRYASLALLIAFPLAYPRAIISLTQTSYAMQNIHDQQMQMARFIAQYYRGQTIAANDIGAISYLADIRLLDLAGLASTDIARSVLDDTYTTERIRQLAQEHRVKIAIAYEGWFQDRTALPEEWIKAGEWTISNNVVCARSTVSFYAVDPFELAQLESNLRAFGSALPVTVRQGGAYLGLSQ